MRRFRRIPLAWLNLTHNRRKLVTSLGGVAFAVLLMFLFSGFQNALYDSQVQLLTRLNADIVLVSKLKYTMFVPESFARRRLYQAQAFDGVVDAYPLYTADADWKNAETRKTRGVRVLAFNPTDPVFLLPEVQEQVDKLLMPDTVMVDLKARAELGPTTPGVQTELAERRVTVVGNYTMGTDFASQNGNVIMSDQNFLRYFADRGPEEDPRSLGTVDIGLIKISPDADANAIAQAMRQRLPKDVVIYTKQEFVNQELTYWRENTQIGFVFTLLTSTSFIVGIILVYQILYTDVADHWAEYATLKAMGYKNIFLLGVVLQEAIILSVLGFIPGFCISSLLYSAATNVTGLLMQMTVNRVLTMFLLTFGMCLVSGMIAVRKVQATDPAEVFG
ncbi:FtsX-like permease family protein [Oscillatoria sp. FACHB-1407]|uniref:ABC transporter permease DevC n=1 Tax=Oscillatoria sp. FACHB-1407 TaxID=2692847 RepID=UPI00168333A6|nr:ABC transporter permease DevC [Oscillatoria sp. FACHB-1407]MBD2462890.1 FtsX-like permease family protein [Oscillatoria sp. FACHB-1407]